MISKKVFFLIFYFLLPVLLIAAIFSSNPGYYGSSGFVPMILGATAYTLLNLQLILSARPKLIEQYFGLDRIYRFHGLVAIVAILAAFIHKLLEGGIFPESFQTRLGDLAVGIFIFGAVLSLIFMVDTLTRHFKPFRLIRKYFSTWKFTGYNGQLVLHNVNVAAVVLIFIHVMLSYSAQNVLVRSLYILYFGAAIAFYLYHKIIRRYFLSKRFTIENVIHESDSMTTLVLRPETGSVFHYLPGQFGFLRLQDRSVSQEEHPFSFSSQPLNRESLTVTVKNLGDWTAGVQAVEKGSKALLDAPYGRFSPVLYQCNKGIVLIAGGVGITPILSILRYYFEVDKERKIILFWGANQRRELICPDEFSVFQKEMKNFTFVPVLANDPDFVGEKGYITKDLIQQKIKESGLRLSEPHFFFCGPAPMWTSVRNSLKAMKIEGRMIHYENFSL